MATAAQMRPTAAGDGSRGAATSVDVGGSDVADLKGNPDLFTSPPTRHPSAARAGGHPQRAGGSTVLSAPESGGRASVPPVPR